MSARDLDDQINNSEVAKRRVRQIIQKEIIIIYEAGGPLSKIFFIETIALDTQKGKEILTEVVRNVNQLAGMGIFINDM